MEDKISIIVPVYNVELYLEKCIETLVNQTYRNLEIILVDDGSPDNCPQICDEWAKRDKRINVIHKENGGLSDARNAGLQISTGEYISFVDSDDLINRNYIWALYYSMQSNDAEIAACDVKEFYVDNEIDTNKMEIETVKEYMPGEALEQLISGVGVRAVAWNKMYKRVLLEKEFFPKGRFHEDEFFTYRIIDKAKKIVYVDSVLYYYRQRQGSIMTTVSIKHVDALEAFVERLYFLKQKYPMLYMQDKPGICILCAMHYREALRNRSEEAKRMLKRIKECRKKIMFTPKEICSYSLYKQFYIIGTGMNMDLFCKILNWKRG